MKNKILLLSVIILVIVIAAAQFVSKDNILYALNFNKSKSTLAEELSNFAVPDEKSIDKIFIADKQNNSVTLTKTEQGWRVNDKFYAREDAIENIMQAITKLRVKNPISRAEHNTQIKRLAAESRKVEIYQNGQKVKTYYMGGSTQDQYGTYAILEGSSVPFVVHIPGFLGFLTPRFFALEELWRENFIFKADPKTVNYVEVVNSEQPERSFTLIKNDNQYQVLNYQNQKMNNIDSMQVKYFLSSFKKLSYEAMIVEMDADKRDSLMNTQAFHTITIKAGKNNQQVIKTYHVKNETHYNDDGELLLYDPDRMYATFNNAQDMATVQFRTFDNITIDPRAFQAQ